MDSPDESSSHTYSRPIAVSAWQTSCCCCDICIAETHLSIALDAQQSRGARKAQVQCLPTVLPQAVHWNPSAIRKHPRRGMHLHLCRPGQHRRARLVQLQAPQLCCPGPARALQQLLPGRVPGRHSARLSIQVHQQPHLRAQEHGMRKQQAWSAVPQRIPLRWSLQASACQRLEWQQLQGDRQGAHAEHQLRHRDPRASPDHDMRASPQGTWDSIRTWARAAGVEQARPCGHRARARAPGGSGTGTRSAAPLPRPCARGLRARPTRAGTARLGHARPGARPGLPAPMLLLPGPPRCSGCALAGLRPLRTRVRYLSSLIAMSPLVSSSP